MTEGTFAKSGRVAALRPPQTSGKAVLTKPPCRLLRCGVTLVELLIAMLILTIVCLAWLEIIGIQSARKEARRREAVERLSGMMDVFLYCHRMQVAQGYYRMTRDGNTISFEDVGDDSKVFPVFNVEDSPIGYQLCVVPQPDWPSNVLQEGNWGSGRWLIGRLYERNGMLSEAGKSFFTLPVFLGF